MSGAVQAVRNRAQPAGPQSASTLAWLCGTVYCHRGGARRVVGQGRPFGQPGQPLSQSSLWKLLKQPKLVQ